MCKVRKCYTAFTILIQLYEPIKSFLTLYINETSYLNWVIFTVYLCNVQQRQAGISKTGYQWGQILIFCQNIYIYMMKYIGNQYTHKVLFIRSRPFDIKQRSLQRQNCLCRSFYRSYLNLNKSILYIEFSNLAKKKHYFWSLKVKLPQMKHFYVFLNNQSRFLYEECVLR